MKKAVITILGLILPPREGQERAKYYFSNDLKEKFNLNKDRYTNMLPLLVDNFQKDNMNIECIYTNFSKDKQTTVLEYEKLDFDISNNGVFISEDIIKDKKEIEEGKYSYFLNKYNELIERYDKVIIDVSHGFRHFPILAIINLIIQNIKNPEKIEYIFFAKEIIQYKEYEIIDLKEYLELAQLSFVLANFNENYTVGNKLIFNNEDYQKLVDNLRIISSNILGNSLQRLIDGEDSLISITIEQFQNLLKDENIKNFSLEINEIIKHLQKIQELKNEKNHIKLFKLSEMMSKREYLLNSITLLNESIGLYCAEKIGNISDKIKSHIDTYLKEDKSNLYELAHQSKNIIKNENSFNGNYLFEPNKITLTSGRKTSLQNKKKSLKSKISNSILEEIKKAGLKIEFSTIDIKKDKSIKSEIIEYLKNEDNSKLIDIIKQAEQLRNNLAHGNSSDEVDNVKGNISKLLRSYKKII